MLLTVLRSSWDSTSEGRFGDERVGLIDAGGVMDACDTESPVDEELADTTSTCGVGALASRGALWKLALERRRSCFKNDMVETRLTGRRTGSSPTMLIKASNFFPPGETNGSETPLVIWKQRLTMKISDQLSANGKSENREKKKGPSVEAVRNRRLRPFAAG